MASPPYAPGDQIVSSGVTYTYNGRSWTYKYDPEPGNGISVTKTVVFTPVPDEDRGTLAVNDQRVYDFNVLSGLATGALYANTVKAG